MAVADRAIVCARIRTVPIQVSASPHPLVVSPQQGKLLKYIVEFRRANGVSPSHPEMCKILGLAGSNNAMPYLRPLLKKGLLQRATTSDIRSGGGSRASSVARGYYPTENGSLWVTAAVVDAEQMGLNLTPRGIAREI